MASLAFPQLLFEQAAFGYVAIAAAVAAEPALFVEQGYAGGEDVEAGAVSFRYRDGRQDNGVPIAEAIERIVGAVRARVQV